MSNKFIEEIKKDLSKTQNFADVKNVGYVLAVKDGIVLADGLSEVGSNEVVEITTRMNRVVKGLVLNLLENTVGIVVLGDYEDIQEGDEVVALGKLLGINVDESILGRVIDPLGEAIDGKGKLKIGKEAKVMSYDKTAPGVIGRKDVNRPLQTGIKAIDALIPIGRGQRELIIGDRQTGKTAIAIDTIINQAKESVKCIYVAIGQKASKIAQIKTRLESIGAMKYTVIVNAGASDPASLQYLAPYTGTAIGEYFAEKGEDALVIYDDLTKHAWAYREISLLLRRPPGREAYPGDVFYLHSKLLERALQFSDEEGGGSLTALPVIETQAGDVSAYIPTNVISITDGQIYLESDLFNAGQRPAVNAGLSVSRVGGSAQTKGMKGVSGQLRLDLAQYRELAAFAQFGSDLDEDTKNTLKRGEIMTELLKQSQYEPVPLADQTAILYAGTNGYLDGREKNEVLEWERGFRKYLSANHKDLIKELAEGAKVEGKLEEKLIKAIEDFNF
ncbi:F0F1 ATP synthase subunit alpha [Candidatus Dojkabacteria bacterium]|nr:F0F1 ATP synthase subunit alpha [Candidatus Dojkabacteria bacterium]